MQKTAVFGILLALLMLLGSLLYIAAQAVLRWMKSEHISFSKGRAKLWVWRSFIVVLMLYSVFLLAMNKTSLYAFFEGPLEIFLTIFIIIYFAALVELVVIDLLLPDVVHMWKRIMIEVLVFLLLCVLTVASFNLSLVFLAAAMSS